MSAATTVLASAGVVDAQRRRRALDLARLGHQPEAAQLCLAILDEEVDGRDWLAEQVVVAMEQPDLGFAGELAAILTAIERGSQWRSALTGGATRPVTDARLSTAKLLHDLQQLRHLRGKGVAAPLDEIIGDYEATLDRLVRLGVTRAPLTDVDERTIGRAFGRLVHVAEAPRVAQALSLAWDRQLCQHRYLESRPNLVVIDDFLTSEALESLLRFCHDSTIWAGNRYAYGRLSSLFFTGFNAPIVLQIAEEIRAALPLLIGERHPLRQLWAFKNTGVLPADSSIHADFAAINVNFWITPDDANLHAASGGMVVYDLEAPLSWSFHEYNERPDLIRDLITRQRPRAIRIPYRQNRAIIFNSDLFHGTEAVCFRPDYLTHRINVTMLYGDRRTDEHHAEPRSAPESVPESERRFGLEAALQAGPPGEPTLPRQRLAAWRSAALARPRSRA